MGRETKPYSAPQLWKLVPIEIKDALLEKIKLRYYHNCPCSLCKTCIVSVGFV